MATRPTNPNPTRWLYTDDVSGIVIGDITFPYQFHIQEEIAPGTKVDRCVARHHFANDAEAAAWFREAYPAEFAHGVEMRVYDQ